jgi:hypothetical protein
MEAVGSDLADAKARTEEGADRVTQGRRLAGPLVRRGFSLWISALANTAVLAGIPAAAFAQGIRSDAGSDADDARNDAMLAMPNLSTPTPLSNLYATAPGLEEQIPTLQLGANLLLPLGWDSNPREVSSGGASSWEASPLGNASLSAPIGAWFRFTAIGFGELNRYFAVPDVDVDRIGGSARLQYVDPTNDQAFSPYVAYAARRQWASEDSGLNETRQDFNLGFNKRFNLDGAFQLVPSAADTSAQTVWSFGLTAFAQRRVRDLRLSSDALVLIPSASYVISNNWSASFAVELLGRWYEADLAGETSRDWEAFPIATLEYVIPASFLGGESFARVLGRPALDFQGSYLKVWSTVPNVSFGQWDVRATIRMGWRF